MEIQLKTILKTVFDIMSKNLFKGKENICGTNGCS